MIISVPNFSFSNYIEVTEKFVVGWGWLEVTIISSLNPSCNELELGLGFDQKNSVPKIVIGAYTF